MLRLDDAMELRFEQSTETNQALQVIVQASKEKDASLEGSLAMSLFSFCLLPQSFVKLNMLASDAQTPREIRMRLLIDLLQVTISGHQFNRAHTPSTGTVLACQPAAASTEQIPNDSNARRESIQWGQTIGRSRLDDLFPRRSWLYSCRRCLWLNLDVGHIGKIDQQRTVRRVRMSVSPSLHRNRQIVFTCKDDSGLHIRGTSRQDNHCRMLVERLRIPRLTRPLIPFISWKKHASLQTRP